MALLPTGARIREDAPRRAADKLVRTRRAGSGAVPSAGPLESVAAPPRPTTLRDSVESSSGRPGPLPANSLLAHIVRHRGPAGLRRGTRNGAVVMAAMISAKH